MTRCDDAAGGDVVAPVAAVIRRVAEEDTGGRPRGELVWCGGGDVGKAPAAEHTKLVVGGRNTEKHGVRRRVACGAARAAVDEVRCRGERLCPEFLWSCTVN